MLRPLNPVSKREAVPPAETGDVKELWGDIVGGEADTV